MGSDRVKRCVDGAYGGLPNAMLILEAGGFHSISRCPTSAQRPLLRRMMMEGLWGMVPASPATLTSATLFPLHFGFPNENSLTKDVYGLKEKKDQIW